MATESYETFINAVLEPKLFNNLTELGLGEEKEPAFIKPIRIRVFENSNQPSRPDFVFTDLFPFETVADLCTRIYKESDKRDEYHPDNLCLLIQTKDSYPRYNHFQYSLKGNDGSIIILDPPFELLERNKPDRSFVDIAGNSKFVDVDSRLNLLLESAFPETSADEYVLNLYLYSKLYEIYTGPKPVDRVRWEGIFRVYFPQKEKNFENGSLPPVADAYKNILVDRLECREKMIQLLNELLQGEGTATNKKPGENSSGSSARLSNIRNLRFRWNKIQSNPKKYKPFDIEAMFYDTPVSETVPYIRFYPKNGGPISKVHVEGGPLNIPSMKNPELLLQWSSELKSITPQENLIMLKILLRAGGGSVNPLYATMYCHQDGSAKFIIQPDSDTRALNVNVDLANLATTLNKVCGSFPKIFPVVNMPELPALTMFTPKNISLDDAYIILTLNLELGKSKAMTNKELKKQLNKVLPYYAPFFQPTASPIQFQNPIQSLRFKCIDNFRTPARDFQFLHRIIDLYKLQGRSDIRSLVPYYIEQFDVPKAVAETRVASFLQNMAQFELVNEETLEYTQKENPGIDIALFGRYPSYTVHIYRVNSLTNLRRIKTLFTLLMNVEYEEFKEIRSCLDPVLAQAKEEEEQVEQEAQGERDDAEEEEEQGGEPPSAISQVMATRVVEENLDAGTIPDFGALGLDLGLDQEESSSEQPAQSIPVLLARAEPEVEAEAPEEKGSVASDDEEEDEITDAAELKKTKAKTYFLKRLNFYDKRLFQYTKSHPSLKKYSSMCAANAYKQPTVMSLDEFKRMKKFYETGNNFNKTSVFWVEYPIPSGQQPPKPTAGAEVITVLKYGSSGGREQDNVYICSKYWCRQDDIVVLEKDYFSDFDRNGVKKNADKQKNIGSCPICHKGPVMNRLTVEKDEAVIDRSGKAKTAEGKRHLYINFLKKMVHPEGLYLPCCFLKDKEIFEDKHPAYTNRKLLAEKASSGEPVTDRMERAQVQKYTTSEGKIIHVNYAEKLDETNNWYILGSEKLPLEVLAEGPQIGILYPAIDKFFSQDSRKDLVVQDHTVWKLLKDRKGNLTSSGFLRIAVENRKRFLADSFLSAIAPFYNQNSASEMKALMMQPSLLGNPRLFLAMNYGNFLFDFYMPDTQLPENFDNLLRVFAQAHGMEVGVGIHKEAMIRLWKSYQEFTRFMEESEDIKDTKEFRHFAKFLSTPNMLSWNDGDTIRKQGIMFIVIEVSLKDKTVEIRCPPYGISPLNSDKTNGCDVGFLINYKSTGIWEPVVYTKNIVGKKRSDGTPLPDIHETYMVFSRERYPEWPPIVKQRVEEYQAMCHSSGLGIYTDSPLFNTKSLLPLSQAMNLSDDTIKVHAILRDTYNHVSAVIFKIDESKNSLVLVPVIDDGSLYPYINVELAWQYFMKYLASASSTEKFYLTKLQPFLERENFPTEISNSYKIASMIRADKILGKNTQGRVINAVSEKLEKTGEKGKVLSPYIYALHLQNGMIVPVSTENPQLQAEIYEEGTDAPWMIDIKLAFGKYFDSKTSTSKMEVTAEEFEEIYQHLRLTFANWVAESQSTKKELEQLLFKNGKENLAISLNEKRKRLLIKFGYTVYGWLDSSVQQAEKKPSLKRVDCRLANTEEQCTNRCTWKQDKNRCLLHVPEKYRVGASTDVDAKTLMIKRLIEELIRFPLKREELLSKKVNTYSKLTQGFRSGNEYIVPESSADWFELMRMGWLNDTKEQPKYAEEFSSIQKITWIKGPIPELILTTITPNLKSIYFLIPVSNSILSILESSFKIPLQVLKDNGQNLDDTVLSSQDVCIFVSKSLKLSIIQLEYKDYTPADPIIFANKYMLDEKLIAPYLIFVKIGKQIGTSYNDGVVGIVSSALDKVSPVSKFNFLYGGIQKEVWAVFSKSEAKQKREAALLAQAT